MADGLTAEPEHFEIDAPEETPQDAQLSSSSSPKSKLEREGSRDVDAVNLKESARPALVAIGDALLEMTASVGELYIERYGLQKNRHVLGDETHIPLFRDLWEHHTPELCNTGSTQTAIRCCQALLDTPYAAAVICSVGNDQFAQAMEELNDAEEVLSLFVRIPEKPTGMSAALCNNNERAQVTNLAANNDFPLDHLRFKVWDYVEDSSICFASGLFLTACPPALLVLAQHCAKAGKPFCLDLAAPFVVEFYLEGLRSLIPYCDYIFASGKGVALGGKWEEGGGGTHCKAELSMYARAMHMNPEGGSESRHHGSSSNSAGGHGGAFGTQGALSLEDIAARLASSPKANVDSRRSVRLFMGLSGE
uniref:Adenosine kinase n=1 Tax=Chromera velia CCMP2878 TaxID=1169474 RepID=A0A0G4IEE8_9ALVE|eukprot:Cvel_13699.t1-p1 / transcript=Cvel_13699.t1 / gene=Cvel_13699 / organism=Chromera_velia_CCMP2878 / gene_product=Adenosine kinase, putative / transcript_product=Adenosine kinase, putative / location=Cvel_scaffold946:52242-54385(-) / protein_length=363 / sequence_SO=supercontig / SO=protein_coding / is_pseudo=false